MNNTESVLNDSRTRQIARQTGLRATKSRRDNTWALVNDNDIVLRYGLSAHQAIEFCEQEIQKDRAAKLGLFTLFYHDA